MLEIIKKILLNTILGIILALFSLVSPSTVFAQYDHIQDSFIVSPAKHEIRLSAGESVIRNIYITNKYNYDADFVISVEDVSSSDINDEVVKYYGKSLGPYSIRNYIMVENDHIRVLAGETKVIPMMISLPANVKPGGFYGSVFVSIVKNQKNSGTNISSRIGALIFLRAKGSVVEQGEVKRFSIFPTKKIIWTRNPINFLVSFENKGNIYLNPYGLIQIKNKSGQVIDTLPIEPWFVFPDSTRTRSITWSGLPLFGYFTATLVLNHGYTIPEATTLDYQFFVFPTFLVFVFFVIIILGIIINKLVRKLKKWHT